MWCERVQHVDDPRVADYRNIPDPELLRAHGLFIAEGRQIVRTLLEASPFSVVSLLVSPAALESVRDLVERRDDIPVYLAEAEAIAGISGFNIHRGCLAVGRRPASRGHRDVLDQAHRWRLIVVCEHVGNADNMGGIFRNGAAFGASCVLLGPACCDPLYRKAIRVSSGASLRLPFGTFDAWPGGLEEVRTRGYQVMALTPDAGAPDLVELGERGPWPERVALLVGHEGSGLTDEAIGAADTRVRLAMQPGSDSVNVATAAGIAMYCCARRWNGLMQL